MTKMHPCVEAALRDREILNESGKWWATFEATIFGDDNIIVKVEKGVIHSNGFKECKLRTSYYTLNPDGTVHVSTEGRL
jgi:hypothetical protein